MIQQSNKNNTFPSFIGKITFSFSLPMTPPLPIIPIIPHQAAVAAVQVLLC